MAIPLSSNITVLFPYTNPVVFDKPGVYRNYQDAYKYEQKDCFIQKYAPTDRLTIQARLFGIPKLPEGYFYVSLCLFSDIREGIITIENFELSEGSDVFIFNKNIQSLIDEHDLKNRFYLLFQLYQLTENGLKLINEWESNIIEISDDTEDTKLITYSNSRSSFDTIFNLVTAGFQVRVPAYFLHPEPGSNISVFESYDKDLELISGTPFETINLYMGGNIGFPDWYIKNLSHILLCDTKLIDYEAYEITSESDMSPIRQEGYNFSWLNVAFSKSVNNHSNIFFNEVGIWAPVTDINVPSEQNKIPDAEITIDSNDSWYVEVSDTWVRVEESVGFGTKKLTYSIDQNLTPNDRTIEILVRSYKDASVFETIKITQSKTNLIGIGIGIIEQNFTVKRI